MTEYTVTWEIQIEADTPREAAKEALKIHRDPFSCSTMFEVSTPGLRSPWLIDLEVDEDEDEETENQSPKPE